MSTNNQTESLPETSIWRGNDIAPEQGRKLVVMTIEEHLQFAKFDQDNDFVDRRGGILTATIWQWTYLDELLSLTRYEGITLEIKQERIKQREIERAERLKKVHKAEDSISQLLQEFLSDATGGKVQVKSIGVIKMRKD